MLATFLEDLMAGRRAREWEDYIATHYGDRTAERIRREVSRLTNEEASIESIVVKHRDRLRG